MMSLKARIAGLESQVSTLRSENARLSTENQKWKEIALVRASTVQSSPHSHGASASTSRREQTAHDDQNHTSRAASDPSSSTSHREHTANDDGARFPLSPQPKYPGEAFRTSQALNTPTKTTTSRVSDSTPTSTTSRYQPSRNFRLSYANVAAGPPPSSASSSSSRTRQPSRRGSADSGYLPPYSALAEEESQPRPGPSQSARSEVGEGKRTLGHSRHGSSASGGPYEIWHPPRRSTPPATTTDSSSSHAVALQRDQRRDSFSEDHETRHDRDFAVQMQRDLEDETIRSEFQHLATVVQSGRDFKCHICLEVLPEDYVARVMPCSHEFCRTCLKGHISSTLQQHRFPIFCPYCIAENARHEPSSSLFLSLSPYQFGSRLLLIHE
jgi:hypothetical protein